MDYEEILDPVALYRDRLKVAHAENTARTFDALLQCSGVDTEANAALVKLIGGLELEVASLDSKVKLWSFFRILMICIAIAGTVVATLWLIPILGGDDFGVGPLAGSIGGIVSAAALTLIFAKLNGKIKQLREMLATQQGVLQSRMDEAWQMMEPLNRLYRWDTVAMIVMQTLPIMAIDRYVSEKRLRQLIDHFQWGDASADNRSVLACQSGAINGNPWVLSEELTQTWGVKTYTGSLTITWEEKEYYNDYNGKLRSRWVTKHETLVASINKPIPEYAQHKRLIYGNEAAPDLHFSRESNRLSSEKSGFFGSHSLKHAIAALEKKSRDLNNSFTIMDNREFDACFNAVNRDHEQQFRVLFTPLAQQKMLQLLRDGEVGYGDDFCFIKHGMINTLISDHLNQLDISGTPEQFKNYDLETARKNFNEYSNDFFKKFFFSFAPIFCIPVYQQHRSFLDIYQRIIEDGEASFCEHESLVNEIGEEHFRPSNAVTRCILKTSVSNRSGSDAVLNVVAHAFRSEERTEYVSTHGGDGKWHDVPVHWTEYLPVSLKSRLPVCVAGTADHLEFAKNFAKQQEWKSRIIALDSLDATPWFRRGLAAMVRRR